MSRKESKAPNQIESKNANRNRNYDESEIPYRRSLIIQQFNEYKMLIQNQEEQIKEKDEKLANEVKIRNNLNSKIFDYERRINDLESINIFQKNEIDKKDKKINLLNREINLLRSKSTPSNDFSDQEAKDMIDHLNKELDEKDSEIMKLNIQIQSLLKEKNSKEIKISTKDFLLHSNDLYSENKENQERIIKNQSNNNKPNSKSNKVLNPNSRATTSSPSKSSTSNFPLNQNPEPIQSKNNKTYKKIKVKKVKNDKPVENSKKLENEYEINIDVVTDSKTNKHEPHYKSKSPPKLDIPSISASQRLKIPSLKENNSNNDDYEEDELPNTARSAVSQNKTLKVKRNTNTDNNDKRDLKSDDEMIKPKQAKTKRIARKKKIIKQKTVNTKGVDKNINDDSNNELSYSEPSQSTKKSKKVIKKTTRPLRKKNTSPIHTDSDFSDNNEKSKTQPINKIRRNPQDSNNQRKVKMNEDEPLPNINIDESDNNNDIDSYQSSDEGKLNTKRPVKTKKLTRKIIRRKVINEIKNGSAKNNNDNLNKDSNDVNNANNNKNKKRRVVKRKISQVPSNDKAKTSTNLLINKNRENESSGSLDSNDLATSQKLLAVQSIQNNKNNLNNENGNCISTPLPTNNAPNTAKSRTKLKPRSKAKTINVSKPQSNIITKTDQAQLKQQQSQPQINNNQVNPQNYGDSATIASRAAWLNNELFGQNPNSNNKNIDELYEHVVTTNKAIVRNPRRGVNRRPPTILNDA